MGGNCHGASWAGVQHEEQAFDVAHKHVNRRQIQRQRILRCACKQLSQNPIGIVTCDLAFNFVVDHPITFFLNQSNRKIYLSTLKEIGWFY